MCPQNCFAKLCEVEYCVPGIAQNCLRAKPAKLSIVFPELPVIAQINYCVPKTFERKYTYISEEI
jgi:hypothetical protein